MIRNNHVARSVNAWADLLRDDPLFTPCGGVFRVPSPRVLKAYVDQRFIDYIQAACDEVKSGYSAERIIEHIKLGAKAVGYKIRGQIRDKKETFKGSLGG
jgi:hypothetical protein